MCGKVQKHSLKTNMRVQIATDNSVGEFAKNMLQLGSGQIRKDCEG
jgi:hypothetical protein